MGRINMMCLDAGICGLILFPVFLLLNRYYFQDRKKCFQYFILAVYLSGVFSVAGLPDVCYVRFSLNANLRPFAYMFSDYRSSLLNIMLFIPMGFLIPCLFTRYQHIGKMLLFGFCSSAVIETLQIFTYRASDINDLMTNTLGALIGWILARIFLLLFPSTKTSGKTKDLYFVAAITFLVMFFVHPYLTRFLVM